MDTRDIRDELLGDAGSRPIVRLNRRHLVLAGVVIVLGIYTYHLLYGQNSLLKLISLSEEASLLENRIETLKNENAQLQRILYELKLIRGDQ
ncbi:MAG: hypothetical protein AB7E49_03765 [Campylobacterales bacterium]